MGLTGCRNTFQSLMEKVLVGIYWKFTIPYLDDCIILSRTIEEDLNRLREVLRKFRDANRKINPTKNEFLQQKVPYLGNVISRKSSKLILRKFLLLTSTQYHRTLPKSKVS